MGSAPRHGEVDLVAVLRAMSTGTLKNLLQGLQGGQSPDLLSFHADSLVAGDQAQTEAIKRLLSLNETPRLLGVLEGALAQRDAQQRTPVIAYSGALAPVKVARPTRHVFTQMFRGAEREVMATSYAMDDPELRTSLKTTAERGVHVTLYCDVEQDSRNSRPLPMTKERIESLLRHGPPGKEKRALGDLWPAQCPNLRLRYDRRLLRGEEFASIHAKCVVVDARWCFITSANLTSRGQERNVEIGVLLDDVELAKSLLQLFGSLMAKGDFVEIAP